MMVGLVLGCALVLLVAYRTYGRLLGRLLRLDDANPTPAVAMRDDVDYAPLETSPLLSQHFSAIAAAGPIVGPILAGALFGWVPAMLWILCGAIWIGGVHDFSALVASVRHSGRSIAEVVRQHVSGRSFVLFLTFVWLALIYIIVAFTDVTAGAFVGSQTLEDGTTVSGGGIATSSLLYLALPIIMGLLVRSRVMSMERATIVFLPLVALSIWVGQKIPFDVAGLITAVRPGMSAAEANMASHKAWDVALLVYCAIASVVPMWLLLQPRGQLGGWFLYAALAAGAVGLLMGGQPIQLPAFRGWTADDGSSLFPMLFVVIACGACSGFHALIASGTTSKQLRREGDSRVIGYGAMLLEAMVAMLSLCCVMMLSPDSELVKKPVPNLIYAQGIGAFLGTIRIGSWHIPPELTVSFALMAFTTFVYDTLDVCTRLGRYIIQELTGWRDARGRWLGTILTAGTPVFFVMQTTLDAKGNPVPVWKTFWTLFGASNQLLAALTLLSVTVWLWRTRRVAWVWLVTGIPTVWMYVMSSWALVQIMSKLIRDQKYGDPVLWVAALLVVLALLMLIEAVAALIRPPNLTTPVPASAAGRT